MRARHTLVGQRSNPFSKAGLLRGREDLEHGPAERNHPGDERALVGGARVGLAETPREHPAAAHVRPPFREARLQVGGGAVAAE